MAAALAAITTPAMIGLVIALEHHPRGAELREIFHLFGPLMGLVMVFTVGWIIYLWELRTNKELAAKTRKRWGAALFLFPWAMLAFWWIYVRRPGSFSC